MTDVKYRVQWWQQVKSAKTPTQRTLCSAAQVGGIDSDHQYKQDITLEESNDAAKECVSAVA